MIQMYQYISFTVLGKLKVLPQISNQGVCQISKIERLLGFLSLEIYES